jgi:hypothetical protein
MAHADMIFQNTLDEKDLTVATAPLRSNILIKLSA